MKKLMAVILTLCMALSLLPTAAFAVEDDAQTAEIFADVPDPGDDEIPEAPEAPETPEAPVSSTVALALPSAGKSGGSAGFTVIPDPESDPDAYTNWKAAEYGDADLSDVSSDEMFSNEYLNVWVDNGGQFTIGCTGGDPDNPLDDGKILLFGHNYGGRTSETVIQINGVDYRFHNTSATTTRYDDHSVTVRSFAGGLTVTQTLTLVNNPQTGREDIVQIKYDYTNTSNQSKQVGVRIMLDTMLGSNDGAPFRVDEDRLTSEREYVGDAIPQYWLCFDRFNQPNVTAVGTLYTNAAEKPDKVQFAKWNTICGSSWDYVVDPNRYMTDSAVAVYFDPADLPAGATKTVVTYYGISGTIEDNDGKLAMRVANPAALNDAGNGNYESNPFDVTAYVRNEGTAPLTNLKINLVSDDDSVIKINSGEEKTIASLAPNAEAAVRWTLEAVPQNAKTTATYRVTGEYDGQKEPMVLNLSTELSAVQSAHSVKFMAENGDVVAERQVRHNSVMAAEEIPAVPAKAATSTEYYVGYWDWANADPAVDPNNIIIAANTSVKAAYEARLKVQSVTMNPTTAELHIGDAQNDHVKLTATVSPANAYDTGVTWTSYNTDIATVDANGNVKAVAVGTTTVAAISNENSDKFAACTVTVVADVLSINATPAKLKDRTYGDPLDITGLKVTAHCSDGKDYEITDYSISGYNPTPAELVFDPNNVDDEGDMVEALDSVTQTLTISHPNAKDPSKPFTTTVKVTVNKAPAEVSYIMISRTPDKRLNYVQGDELDLTGMQVDVFYTDGTQTLSPIVFTTKTAPEGFTVTGYDPMYIGNQALTLTYGGVSQQFSIRVLENLDAQPDTTNYIAPRVSIESVRGGKRVTMSQVDVDGMPKGTIYYTLDGTVPTKASTPYNENEEIVVDAEKTTVKAIVVGSTGKKSPIATVNVYVEQVKQPIASNPNHRNNQGPNRTTTTLEPGTLVSFQTDTAGASIYYWVDTNGNGRQDPGESSAENSKYGTSVYMKPQYADPTTGITHIYVYAVKDGYKNSTPAHMIYKLNLAPERTETATFSIGTNTSRSAENLSTTLSINSTAVTQVSLNRAQDIPAKVVDFTVKVHYDSTALEFLSVNSLTGEQVLYANSTDNRNGGVLTLEFNGENPVETGEMCALNFRARDSSQDSDYALTIDQNSANVVMEDLNGRQPTMLYRFYDGVISLQGSHNDQLTARAAITDANGDEITSLENVGDGGEYHASINITLPENSASRAAALQALEDMKVMNIFLAIYNKDQMMVSLQSWDVDVTNPANLSDIRLIRIPKEAKGGTVRFMFMDENLAPTAAVSSL